MSLLRRRAMMELAKNDELFDYIKDYTFQNIYGRINININAEDNSLYLLIPRNQEELNTIFVLVNVRNGKYGFSYCNEDTNNGLLSYSNYDFSNGAVSFQIVSTNNGTYDVTFEVYRFKKLV